MSRNTNQNNFFIAFNGFTLRTVFLLNWFEVISRLSIDCLPIELMSIKIVKVLSTTCSRLKNWSKSGQSLEKYFFFQRFSLSLYSEHKIYSIFTLKAQKIIWVFKRYPKISANNCFWIKVYTLFSPQIN